MPGVRLTQTNGRAFGPVFVLRFVNPVRWTGLDKGLGLWPEERGNVMINQPKTDQIGQARLANQAEQDVGPDVLRFDISWFMQTRLSSS